MNTSYALQQKRRLYLMVNDWTWWVWLITAVVLLVGLMGYPGAFILAMAMTVTQTVVIFLREKRFTAFAVQLRIAYLLLLLVSYPPAMQWLYWLPTIGTFALVVFGYCLMARVLSLLPWNRAKPLSWNLLQRTFFSSPDLSRVAADESTSGCAGGMCTIAAQVLPAQQASVTKSPGPAPAAVVQDE